MSSLITQIRRAVWTALEADADWLDYTAGGRRYDFEPGAFDPGAVAPVDCPCLIVTPAEAPRRFTDPLHLAWTVTLQLRGLTAGANAADIETFHELTSRALMRAWPDFALPDILRFVPGKVAFHRPGARNGWPDGWSFTMHLTVEVEQSLESLTASDP